MTPEERARSLVRHVGPEGFISCPSFADDLKVRIAQAIRDAVAEEREAAAELVENMRDDKLVADAIRARSKP